MTKAKKENKDRRVKKPFDLRRRASSLRSSLRRRSEESTPSSSELLVWLQEQQPFSCYYFGSPVDPNNIHIDHKHPVTMGGTNDLENLCVTSSRVNRAKGQFTEDEFRVLVDFCVKHPEAKDYLLTRLLVGGRVGRKSL